MPKSNVLAFLTTQISVIYFDNSANLGQSYFNRGAWRLSSANSLVVPSPVPALPDSSLSISSNIIPPTAGLSSNFSSSPQNDSLLSADSLLSSVANYQTDRGAVMVDLIGTTLRALNKPYQTENLFSQFKFSNDGLGTSRNNSAVVGTEIQLNTSSPTGFVCAYNIVDHSNSSSPNTQLTVECISSDVYASAHYGPSELGQNSSEIRGAYAGNLRPFP